ncbi:MAG: hypothetical protein AAGC92_10930 [Pseudomonadota bacterium]
MPWLIASGLCLVTILAAAALFSLRRDRDAAPEAGQEGFVLRPSSALGFVATILALATAGFAAGIVGSLLGGGLGPSDVVLGLAGAVALAALIWVRRRRHFRANYDQEGLTLYEPGAKPVKFGWAALADIHRESRSARAHPAFITSQIVARRPDGALIRIPSNLVGFAHFAAFALDMAERTGNRGQDRDS